MKKAFIVLMFLASTISFAQPKSKNLFITDSTITSFSFLKIESFSFIEYKKFFNSAEAFSIYNPKPGFEPTKIKSQKYYSFTNTNRLLKQEMSNIKPEPIFPNQDKKNTIGESIFDSVVSSIFDKKQK